MADFEKSWAEEKQSSYLYEVMAEVETGTPLEALFLKLGNAAEDQAGIWEKKIRTAGAGPPASYVPDLRTRTVAMLIRRIGPKAMLPVLAAMKVRGISIYSAPRAHDEKGHRFLTGGGNLRAAVFGINDGLVSNASLIFGFAGASASPSVVLLSGVAGLLAGAFSMGAGEYVSVRSQREMFEYQIGLERAEIEEYPEEEALELAQVYEAKGIPAAEAKALAEKLMADPEKALDTLAREELGLNPDDLGSAWGAALSSFFSFCVGAFVPLIPFVFLRGSSPLTVSMIFTAVSLFIIGGALSLFTGRHALWSGLRMLLIGGAAGAVTYTIGRLMGVGLS